MNDIVSIGNVKTEEEHFINAIIESGGANLPATIQEIIPVIEFSKARMIAYKALSDAACKVEEQEALNKAALDSGQRWGIVHLYGQKKLGELTREMPENIPQGAPAESRAGITKASVSRGTYQDAERIARNPEILDRVIETAKERGDIPTKGRVIAEIMKKDAKERSEKKKADVLTAVVKEKPKAVKEYFEALKVFKQACIEAEEAAYQGMFAEESLNLVKGKHTELEILMDNVEEAICQN